MDKKNELKVFEYIITMENDGTGLYYNSLVPQAANYEDFHYFNAENGEVTYDEYFVDIKEEERIVTGPSMIPGVKMLRKFRDNSGYYWCTFSEESILNTGKKMSIDGRFNDISFKHWDNKNSSIDASKPVNDVHLIEIFYLNERNRTNLYTNLPNGTMMTTYWVNNDDVWNAIKSGEVKGFSVEVKIKMQEEKKIKQELRRLVIDTIMDDTITDSERFERLNMLSPSPKGDKK